MIDRYIPLPCSRRLEKTKVILGYKSFIDYEKLGVQQFAISFVFLKTTHQRKKEFIQFCKQHPCVVYLEKSVGGPDIEIEVHVKNNGELRKMLDQFKERFVGMLHDYQILHIYEEHKNTYFPLKDPNLFNPRS